MPAVHRDAAQCNSVRFASDNARRSIHHATKKAALDLDGTLSLGISMCMPPQKEEGLGWGLRVAEPIEPECLTCVYLPSKRTCCSRSRGQDSHIPKSIPLYTWDRRRVETWEGDFYASINLDQTVRRVPGEPFLSNFASGKTLPRTPSSETKSS